MGEYWPRPYIDTKRNRELAVKPDADCAEMKLTLGFPSTIAVLGLGTFLSCHEPTSCGSAAWEVCPCGRTICFSSRDEMSSLSEARVSPGLYFGHVIHAPWVCGGTLWCWIKACIIIWGLKWLRTCICLYYFPSLVKVVGDV